MGDLVQGQSGNATYDVAFVKGQLQVSAGYNFGTGSAQLVIGLDAVAVLKEIAAKINNNIVTDAVNVIAPIVAAQG